MGLFDRIRGKSKPKLPYPAELEEKIERAVAHLQALTAGHDGLWRIGRAAWSVDQDAGTITFTPPKGLVATAPVQMIGSYNTNDGTWLWSWSNSSIEPPLTEHAQKVRAFGEEKGYEILTTPKFACPEEQCWDFAALACLVAEAQGAYRGPAGNVRVFMMFGRVALKQAGGS